MLFSSITFLWCFLPLLLICYFVAPKKVRNYVLLAFSLLFYAWGEPKYIILMLLSIGINYIFGLLIAWLAPKKRQTKEKHNKKQTIVLIISILVNLLLLGYFKYANFFIDTINKAFGMNLTIANIALPIGISFYTFQIMSYVIDLYRGEIKVQKNPIKLALYISFFPQLIAGPIVKYRDIDEALSARKETVEGFSYGAKRFVYGLAKKILIADCMAVVADRVFGAGLETLTTQAAWIGAFCYALQIFFDFSGYSDMAIGLGSIFGFKFPENFNLPYISGSITEFWRRWHISLSTWFKEYLYIPLGGNKKGKTRTYINLWVVFLATGIWHGAAWNFLAWGIFHGFFIFIERVGLKMTLDKHKIIGHFYTLSVILFGWILFRASGIKHALKYIKIMFFGQTISGTPIQLWEFINHRTILTIVVGIILAGAIQTIISKNKKSEMIKWRYHKYMEPVCVGLLLFICILAITSNTYTSFIYFRF